MGDAPSIENREQAPDNTEEGDGSRSE